MKWRGGEGIEGMELRGGKGEKEWGAHLLESDNLLRICVLEIALLGLQMLDLFEQLIALCSPTRLVLSRRALHVRELCACSFLYALQLLLQTLALLGYTEHGHISHIRTWSKQTIGCITAGGGITAACMANGRHFSRNYSLMQNTNMARVITSQDSESRLQYTSPFQARFESSIRQARIHHAVR